MLDFITQAIELLIHPPGDLVYYLIILFAIEALLGLAVVRARRTGWTRQLRLILLAAGVMLIGRAVLMVIALLSQQSARPDVLLAGALGSRRWSATSICSTSLFWGWPLCRCCATAASWDRA